MLRQPDSLWNWLVDDWHLQAPALTALHQPASRLAALAKGPVARAQVPDTVKEDNPEEQFRWNYGQLKSAALRVASFLSTQIARKAKSEDKQHVIVTFVYNSAEWAVFLLAAIALGYPFSPLDPGFLDEPEEFHYYMECLDPSILLVENEEAAKKINSMGSNAYVKVMCQANDESDVSNWHNLDYIPVEAEIPNSDPKNLRGASKQNSSMIKGFKDQSDLNSLPEDTAIVLFSSGTTARPKGCPHTAYSFALQVDNYLRMKPCKWDASMKNIMVSSCFRPMCWLSCLITWKAGGEVILPSAQFDPVVAIRALASEKGTHAKLVPPQATAMIDALNQNQELRDLDPTTFRFVSIGGNIVADDLLEDFRKAFSADRVLSIWGMSEGAALIGWDQEDDEAASNPHGLAALGRAFPGTKVRICDPLSDEHKTVSRGTVGEFHLSSPNNVLRYLFNREDDKFYTDDQGSWFITGDHAKMDESGVVYVLGRGKDSIIKKGVVVIPGNIEACLNRVHGIEVRMYVLKSFALLIFSAVTSCWSSRFRTR